MLLEEAERRPFRGIVGTLGKQRVFATHRQLRQAFAHAGSAPSRSFPDDNAIADDVTLLENLGFEKAESLDYSDYEGADQIIDLNSGALPDHLRERYDVLLDSGTIEHVFHVPNALANIHNMVKTGGRIIFIAPSSNHMEHGFYMFSPTFFHDYYKANGLRIDAIYVVRYRPEGGPWHVYEYSPIAWEQFQMGGLDRHAYAVFLVATKTPGSRCDVIPQQGFYADNSSQYAGSQLAGARLADDTGIPSANVEAANASPYSPKVQALRRVLRHVPGLRRLMRFAQWLTFRLGIDLRFGQRHTPYPKLRGRY
ncbi:MAG: hypothetical protein ACK4NA_15445 [Alphaproteobacteria bacterium]